MKKVVFIIQFVFVSQSFALTIDADKILNGKKPAEIQEAITSTQKLCPDNYENDDRKSRAKVIIPNVSGGQHHTFHNSHDEDWIKFFAFSKKKYTIEFRNLEHASLSFDNSTCRRIDISDAIIALQILTGFQHSIILFSDTILGNIDKLGLNDVVRIFHQLNR